MTLHCAFIGFGKSTTRYHLPYVLHRKDRWQVAHILPPPGEARGAGAAVFPYSFHQRP